MNMIYELVNPSDAWTFAAPSDKIAFLVSLLVGRGQTPAKRDEWMTGFYIIGGDPEADFEKQFGEPMKGALDRHREELITSLRTFMIHRDRAKEPLQGDALLAWNEEHRTSVNDFGGYALQLADRLAKKVPAK